MQHSLLGVFPHQSDADIERMDDPVLRLVGGKHGAIEPAG